LKANTEDISHCLAYWVYAAPSPPPPPATTTLQAMELEGGGRPGRYVHRHMDIPDFPCLLIGGIESISGGGGGRQLVSSRVLTVNIATCVLREHININLYTGSSF
jgi:hypothetical protein